MKDGKRIGEIAELTGLSVHALRQWHRRYGIGPSATSDGGQRRYTDQDIERIGLIQTLRYQGFSLNTLADWSLPKLRQQHRQDQNRRVIGWFGASYSTLAAQLPTIDLIPARTPRDLATGADLRVLEYGTLTEDLLPDLPETTGGPVVLWYEFGNRRMVDRLRQRGYELRHGHPTARWLLDRFDQTDGALFAELTRLTHLEPAMNCECPNHLARILKELTGFAQYSLECEVDSPEDATLHRTLFENVQHAQRAVVQALNTVLAAERIDPGTVAETAE